MHEIVIDVLAGLLLAIGIVGCVVPVIPGPVVAYAGLVCLLWTVKPISVAALVAFGILTLLVAALDYIIPALGARKFKGTKLGTIGCFVGTVVGMFFLPIGLLAGPFFGALVGELLAGRRFGEATYGGLGALLGLLSGMAIKLALCIAMVGWYVWTLLR